MENRNYKEISEEEVREAVRIIRESNNEGEKAKAVSLLKKKYEGIFVKMLHKYPSTYKKYARDLESVMNIGFMRAINEFDFDMNTNFSTFLYYKLWSVVNQLYKKDYIQTGLEIRNIGTQYSEDPDSNYIETEDLELLRQLDNYEDSDYFESLFKEYKKEKFNFFIDLQFDKSILIDSLDIILFNIIKFELFTLKEKKYLPYFLIYDINDYIFFLDKTIHEEYSIEYAKCKLLNIFKAEKLNNNYIYFVFDYSLKNKLNKIYSCVIFNKNYMYNYIEIQRLIKSLEKV